MSHPDYEVDVVVIGAGSAGLVARRAAERLGASTLLCDGGTLGTTCARVGCMPSKLLIAPARAARTARKSKDLGVHADLKIDGPAVIQRVQKERDRFVRFVSSDIDSLKSDNKFLPENVSFVEPGILKSASGRRIHYKSAVIATGTTPFVPPPYNTLNQTLYTSDTIFEIADLPKKLAVIGAGVIGLELGQAFSALDVDVTLLNVTDNLSLLRDPEVKASFEDALRQDLRLFQNVNVTDAEERDGQAHLRWTSDDGTAYNEAFDAVLVAAGRRADFEKLGLKNLGVDAKSPADLEIHKERLQLADHPIFMAGDVNGIRPLLHEAADEGRIAGENAAHFARTGPQDVYRYERHAPLGIAFTHPQTANGGVAWSDLPDDAAIGKVSFANQGRARVDLENHGVLRVYGDPDTKRLIGFEMCGPDAEHIAHLLTWAIQQKLTVGAILDMPFYHPVVQEGMRTALQQLAKALGLRNNSRLRCEEGAPTVERENRKYEGRSACEDADA